MLPSHREGATRPLLWFIFFRVVAPDTQVPSDTWDPEDPMPSFCGSAVYWAHAKYRISATACGSLSGQLAGGTPLPWIPAAPTVMADEGPRRPPGVLYSNPRAAAELHPHPGPVLWELLLAAITHGFGYCTPRPMRICGSSLWNLHPQGPVHPRTGHTQGVLDRSLTISQATKNLRGGVCLKK